jgi:oxygen-dependent protoporphyrinogen oxidase
VDVAVVGAGISGLSCAWRLQQAGHHVTVYEREASVGGRMATVEAGGFSIDIGTNLLLSNYDRLRALAGEVGIGDELFPFEAGEGGVLRDGQLTSFDPRDLGDIVRYQGLSRAARLRMLVFLLRSWPGRDRLDFFDLSVGDDRLDTVDAYAGTMRWCGREVAEYLIDPFVRTFHFHSARVMSMKYFDALAALFLARGGFVPHGFRGYMAALPRALAARLPIRRGRVTHVTPVSSDGRRVEVYADGRTQRYDAVVIAVPAPAALAMLAPATPEQHALLDRTRYSSTVVCSYRCPAEVAGDFEGIWVPWQESRIICDCANEGCKGSRDGCDSLLTMCLHEEAAREALTVPDARLSERVAEEWTRLFPRFRGRLRPVFVHRWAWALPVYEVGHLTRVKRFWERGQGRGGVWLCGDYLNQPWVEGSIRCGEKVAAAVG